MESPLQIKSAAFADRILDMSDFLLGGGNPVKSEKRKGNNSSLFTNHSSLAKHHSSLFTNHSSLAQQRVRYSVEVCVKQVTRSGTSIAANIAEGQYAQSKEDLTSKYGIALKEASETRMWLDRLLNRKAIDEKMHTSMTSDVTELISMLVASINTMKNGKKK